MKKSENTTTRIYITAEEKQFLKRFRTLTPENKRKAIALLRRLKASQE